MSKVYKFTQNNSGGFFDGPETIFVEADNAIQANYLAEEYTEIYFDGVYEGRDCNHCGDRWYKAKEEAMFIAEGTLDELKTKYPDKGFETFWNTSVGFLTKDGKYTIHHPKN